MDARTLSVLELPKVLSRLADFTQSEAGREACLCLSPKASLDDVQYASAWFTQGRVWKARTGFFLAPFLSLEGLLSFLGAPSAVLELDALWGLKQNLRLGKELVASLCGEDIAGGSAAWPLLAERAQAFLFPHQCFSALFRCLTDDGRLRDEASPELLLARNGIRSLHQTCTRKVKEFILKYNLEHYLQDDFMTLASDRYVLPLKANFKGQLPGVTHDYSQTGETCYFEPVFLMEVNNRLQELKREEREAEIKLLQYITSLVRSEADSVRQLYLLMVDVDVLSAVALFASDYDGACVDFEKGAPVALYGARHPLLLMQHRQQPKQSPAPVPVDILLEQKQRALVISGGNAGGKTVCMKTLGLIALMGMCGLPVPVKLGARLPFWSKIYAFIGDEQSLEDHVSTFTAQIRNLSQVWPEVDENCLIILDEFGAGTDPAQGAALAQAVVDGILDAGAYVLAATHFPALKVYALSREGVRAASVLFDPKSKKPFFSLAYDQVGSSQALDVAREHGLPDSVLRVAEKYLLVHGNDASGIIDKLNSLAVKREEELKGLEAERKKFAARKQSLEERFAKEKDTLFVRIQEDARKVMRDWKEARVSHKQALKELATIRTELAPSSVGNQEVSPQAEDSFSVGMTVRYQAWGKNGIIREMDNRRKRLRLDLGGISLWVDMADCRSISITTPKATPVTHVQSYSQPSNAKMAGLRLDLRGMRADAALSELERFLDSAIISGRTELEILHGRGTGALRREVHGLLKRFPPVASFAIAPEDQGGDGVTCVILK